jgi:hypothetical protein
VNQGSYHGEALAEKEFTPYYLVNHQATSSTLVTCQSAIGFFTIACIGRIIESN